MKRVALIVAVCPRIRPCVCDLQVGGDRQEARRRRLKSFMTKCEKDANTACDWTPSRRTRGRGENQPHEEVRGRLSRPMTRCNAAGARDTGGVRNPGDDREIASGLRPAARIISVCTASCAVQACLSSGLKPGPNCCCRPQAVPHRTQQIRFPHAKLRVLAAGMADDGLEHLALIERPDDRGDRIHQLELLLVHIAGEQAPCIGHKLEKSAVELRGRLLAKRPQRVEGFPGPDRSARAS